MKLIKSKKGMALGGLVLASALAIGSVSVVNNDKAAKASNEVSNGEYAKAMEFVAQEYAASFANELKNDSGITTTDATPIYDEENSLVGFSVELEKDNVNYGYVNIDYSSDGLVTDFAMEENSRSMYDTLVENFDEANKSIEADECENKLYNTNGLDYAVSAVDEETNKQVFYYNGTTYESDDFEEMLDYYEENYLEYYDNTEYEDDFVDEEVAQEDGESKTDNGEVRFDFQDETNELPDELVNCKLTDSLKEKFKNWVRDSYPTLYNKFFANDGFITPTKYPTHSEVFKNETICELDKQVLLDCYSKEESLLSQEEIMKTTNRYACELVGVTAICQQEGMKLNGNLKDTFNKLWDLAGCQSRIYETGTFYESYVVECSSTYTRDMPGVVKEYAKLFGKKVNGKYESSADFEFFKETIDNQNSASLGYNIAGKGGHGVNVVGYAEGHIGKHDMNYLITGDSWYDDAPRYVYYSKGVFAGAEGCSYDIY